MFQHPHSAEVFAQHIYLKKESTMKQQKTKYFWDKEPDNQEYLVVLTFIVVCVIAAFSHF